MKPCIFIFDFDGTIADTYRHSIEIFNRLAGEFRYDTINLKEMDNLKDKTSPELIRSLKVPLLKIPAIISRAKKEFQKEIHLIKPIDGLSETLPALKKLGVRIGILSSNSLEVVATFLENHHLNIFNFVHTTSKVWSKDASLKKLIKENGFTLEEILYIGDEVRDIVAAQRLGVKVAAVTWGYNSALTLKKYNPDFLIQKPDDLVGLLKQ